MKKSYKRFSFLPYVALKEDIKIGNVLFWPKTKIDSIKNKKIKGKIESFLNQYVNNLEYKEPLQNITMISYKTHGNFNVSTKKIKDAVLILFFATIIKNNKYFALSSDNFQIIHQNFTLKETGIAPVSGSLIRIKHGGLEIKEVLFIKPLHVNIGFLNYDEKILHALEKLQRDKTKKEFFQRIITALEWIGYAYTNIDNFNYSSRIVMLMTAYEFLFNKIDGKFEFVEKIKITCNDLDKLGRNRSKRKIYVKGKKEKKDFSFKEWWAYEFYNLRNKIVHGKVIKNKDLKNRKNKDYLSLGIKFFEECLKRELQFIGYYLYNFNDKILWEDIREQI